MHDRWNSEKSRVQFVAKDGSRLQQTQQELKVEYVRNAEFEFWLQRMFKGIILCFFSWVGLLILCQIFPPLQSVLFSFFRWILIPIKPLLTGTPSTAVAGVLAFMAPILTIINTLAVPVIALAAIKGQSLSHYLITDHRNNRLCLVRPTWKRSNPAIKGYEYVFIDNDLCLVLASMPLSSLQKLTITRPKGKKSILDYEIAGGTELSPLAANLEAGLRAITGDSRRLNRIRWGDIIKPEDRQKFLQFLETLNPSGIDGSIFEPFRQLPDRQSYTELWLKELSGAPKRDKLTPLIEGSTLSNAKYTVQRKMGVGGQGTVYLALTQKNEFVVLKEFVLPVYPDIRIRKKAAERFQTEAAMLSRLNHAQIAKFRDLFVEDHRAYLVLELVEGASLKDLVQNEGSQPEAMVIDIARQIASILDYLHGQEPPVIHRDLTPDNIMLENGLVKLIDFSVAQEASSGVTGSVVGKPNYISPEQFRGKPTEQSDLYSLGATLFYLLIGQDPPPITILHPKAVNDRISDEVDRIVARCTQLDTAKRYASASELLEDLNRISSRVHS